MSRFSLGIALLAVWLLLWGSITVANVVGGVVVIAALYLVFPSARPFRPHHLARPWGVVRLLGFVAKDVVVSTAVVAREIVTPRPRLRATIIDVPLHIDAPSLVTLLAHLIALSPGTMAVKVTGDPSVITMHVLARSDDDSARSAVFALEARCVEAFAPGTVRDAYRRERAARGATA